MDQSSVNTMVLINLTMRSQKQMEQACLQSNKDLVIIFCIKQRDLLAMSGQCSFLETGGVIHTVPSICIQTDRRLAGLLF